MFLIHLEIFILCCKGRFIVIVVNMELLLDIGKNVNSLYHIDTLSKQRDNFEIYTIPWQLHV